MDFSVIIPTLNEADQIKGAVESSWRSGASEIVVADGGSIDQTKLLAVQLGAKVVESSPGRGTQMNEGAKASKNEVLVFLHADSRLPPTARDQLKHSFGSGKRFCFFRQSIQGNHWLYRWIERGNELRASIQKLPYGDQGFTMTRELFNEVNGFDNIPLMEDVLLAKKLSQQTQPHLLDGPLLVSDRRWKENGIIRQTLSNWWTMLKFRLGVSPAKLASGYQRSEGKST